MSARVLVCAVFASFVVACGPDERLSPVPDAGPPSSTVTQMPPPNDAGPPIRTVIQRNPFGDVAVTDNLLWDGDFEWSSPFSDEYGWWQDETSVLADVVIGPSCRSGVKCARLKPGSSVLGIAVSSSEFALNASFYAKFEDNGAGTACSKVAASLVSVGVHDEPKNTLVATTPDADNWCFYSVMAPKHIDKVYLQIRNQAMSPILIDDAIVRATGSIMVDAESYQAATVPTLEDAKEAELLAARVHAHEGPNDAPPNAAKRAFSAFKQPPGGARP